ncbi:M48 family metallopeptidase [Pelagibius sp.]|uniref:M48 family metallopeptidase n=1 Tax=Pelagibius sp. TaxID=1931238 RepID=UPI0026315F3C|nr:SprT family zinc-dependent metalloprotease [Pelagibius sp.]
MLPRSSTQRIIRLERLQPGGLEMSAQDVPLELRRHPQARRISLRLNKAGDGIVLVLPQRTPIREALAFAERNSDWILGKLEAVPARVPFAAGAVIPVLGVAHVVEHNARARRGVWRSPGTITVSGQAEHLPRRLGDFLKREARQEISRRARDKAARIDQRVGRISLRDPRSRWGSCSSKGDLSFSWRLILTPDYVVDYVVAHEVAHLAELNHSKRFWTLTAGLTAEMERAKDWLRREGSQVHRYG